MPQSKPRRKSRPNVSWPYPIEQAKTSVLHSLTSASGPRTYDHAVQD